VTTNDVTTDDVSPIEASVEGAKGGDRAALDIVIAYTQDRVYNLALRMLWLPEDAADATQEILIKVFTHLSQFEGRSSFTTWVYRIATNHLLTTRERRAEAAMRRSTIPEAETAWDTLPSLLPLASPEEQVALTEMQTHCTLGMMLCLDRDLRVAFILGVGFGVSGEEGAAITDTTPAAFRKRVSRARARMHGVLNEECILINPEVACVCTHREGFEAQVHALFGDLRTIPPHILQVPCEELSELDRLSVLYRNHPAYASPMSFIKALRDALENDAYSLLRR